jgi:hypothetical protein
MHELVSDKKVRQRRTGRACLRRSRPVIRRIAEHVNLMAFFMGEGHGETRSGPVAAVAVGADGVAAVGSDDYRILQSHLSKPTFGYWQ